MQKVLLNQQQQNNDTFFRPTVKNSLSFFGSGKYPDEEIICEFAKDKSNWRNFFPFQTFS